MNNTYAIAYTQVLEILKHIPKYEYNKIDKAKIDFFEKNKDINYSFTIDENKPLNVQDISEEANAILVSLYRDYFATEKQKEILNNILEENEKIYQENLRKKYNPDDIFKKETTQTAENTTIENIDEINSEQTQLIEYKENIFTKIIKKIKSIFLKNK